MPRQIEARLVVDQALAVVAQGTTTLLGIHVVDGACGLLHLWIEAAHRDAQLGPAFQDSQAGDAQGQVLLPGQFDEPVQGGVVE